MPEARNRGSSPDAQFLVVSRQLGSRSGQPAPGAAGNGLDVLVLAIDGCRAGAQRTPLCSGKLLQGPVGTGGRVHSPVQEEPSPRSQETGGGRADTENLRSQARPVLLSACRFCQGPPISVAIAEPARHGPMRAGDAPTEIRY